MLAPAREQLLILLGAIIVLYFIVPHIGSFRHSLELAKNADSQLLALSVVFTALSYIAAAGTYWLLAILPLSYFRTLLIQLAGMFVNRLLPAGVGSMSVNYLHLKRSGHTGAQAASVVAANNSLGIIGHVFLLVALLLPLHGHLPDLHLPLLNNLRIIIVVVAATSVLWAAVYMRYQKQIKRSLKSFVRQFLNYRHRPNRLSLALLCSLGLTLSNVLSLWFCVLAMNISIPFIAVFIVFSLGVALGTATPTPGGLGGVEAGLVAGLVVYHVDSASALAAVLVYRLISYWLPLVAGAIAFFYSQRRGYIAL